MPLLLLDLDDTLVDRASAFSRWAHRFATAYGGGVDSAAEADWLIAADRDGWEPRENLAVMIGQRFGLPAEQTAGLAEALRTGLVDHMVVAAEVVAALRTARAEGWVPFVVTNGNTVLQQERKLRTTGLDELLAGWVISAGVGVRKPDRRIFELAARQAGSTLDGAWMIGDSAEADVAGARNAGIRSVWLDRGRPWPRSDFAPDHVASTFSEAVDRVRGRHAASGAPGQSR